MSLERIGENLIYLNLIHMQNNIRFYINTWYDVYCKKKKRKAIIKNSQVNYFYFNLKFRPHTHITSVQN
jgi:hypothetical protein